MYKSRTYQENILIKVTDLIIKNITRIMVSSPTGSGKTVMFSIIAKEYQEKGKRVLIITHRKELLFQAGGTFDNMGVLAHELTAKTRTVPTGDVVVSMVETLYRRVKDNPNYEEFLNQFDLIIIDEGHVGNFDKIFRYIPKQCIVIGFSATPYRRGTANSLNAFYEEMVQGVDVPDLVTQGYLAKPHTYGLKVDLSRVRLESTDYNPQDLHEEYQTQRVYEGVIKNYKKYTPNKKAILFAASVESSMDINIRLNAAGIPSAHVDANTPDNERREIFDGYRSGRYRVLCNVGIATMGFDDPDTEVVILYRATKSLPLFLQMVGRGSRVTPDKSDFYIMDFGQNTDQHGFWEQPRLWTLENDTSRFRRESNMTKECPECGELNPISTTTCKGCGYVWERERREVLREAIVAELQELDGFGIQVWALHKTFEELQMIQEAKNYKEAWILHQLTSEQDLRQYARYKGYKDGWVYHMKKRGWKPTSVEQREAEIEAFKTKIREERYGS